MGELVNLNRARKARDKAAGKVTAALNRAAHGRTKAERSETEAEADRRAHALDGAKRETGTKGETGAKRDDGAPDAAG